VATGVWRTGDEDGEGEGLDAAIGVIVEAVGALAAGPGGAQICATVRAGGVWPARSV
jgi:hypothetical protein